MTTQRESSPGLITPAQLRQQAGRVCVAVAGPQMLQLAEKTLDDCKFLEFRLDSLPDPAGMIDHLRVFLGTHRDVTAIATCRRTPFGGSYTGDARAQIDLLVKAAEAGCQLVDVEVETVEELREDAFEPLRNVGAAVIVSWHDFEQTPDLEGVYKRLQCTRPDYIKIVPTAQTLRDSIRLIDLLEHHGQGGRLIAMAMGFKGVLTRVLGPRFGSLFTFASAFGHSGTAPGQVDVRLLRELYRIEQITASTAVFAVAGSPISGSMSPRMHNTAFTAAGLDAVYLPLETEDHVELLEVKERLTLRGLSITMPLKQAVLPHIQFPDNVILQMGACNTFSIASEGEIHGFNTDIEGIVGPLSRRLSLHGARILILGAGGSALAAAYGMHWNGADVFILNRTAQKAARLAGKFAGHVQARETLAETSFDAIINCTPYGMRNMTIDAPILAAEMNCKVFFDLVYNPIDTPLIMVARQRGIETIPGIEMFVEQGVSQFLIWLGVMLPPRTDSELEAEQNLRTVMLRAVQEALDAQQA